MLRALGFSIIAHLLVLTLFYERVFDASSAKDARPAIRAEIMQAVSATPAESISADSQLVEKTEQRKESKTPARSVGLQDDVAVASQPDNSQKIERNAAVDGAVERHSESLAPPVRPVSQDGLRQYGINVAKEARKHKRFPSMARQRGWEGEVNVVIGTAAGTVLPLVSLSKGSGFEALDQAALDMVRAAVRDAQMPEELHGRAFALTLPIRFSLED
jgi:protein TonB